MKNQKALFLFVILIFVTKLFDSLYVRQHGDALNYHLYAPLLWSEKGFLYYSLFQSTHYQAGWWEYLITVAMKLVRPIDFQERACWVIVFQVISCAVAYLGIPFLLWRHVGRKLSGLGQWLLILGFYASEYMFFTSAFAKNDAIAAASFLLGALSPVAWVKILFLGFSVGVKGIYLYGVALYLLLFYKQMHKGTWIFSFVSVGFFQGVTTLHKYLATGNPIFPFPFSAGAQTSLWLRDHFLRYIGTSNPYWIGYKFVEMFSHSPVPLIVILLALVIGIWKFKSLLKLPVEIKWLLVPFIYLLITGIRVEWRLFSGVTILALVYGVKYLDEVIVLKNKKSVFGVICVLALVTSKIDFSSFSRWQSGSVKSYADLIAFGKVFERVNSYSSPEDIVLMLLHNEGFFLKPLIYTINEHPMREEIMQKFPLLQDGRTVLWISTNGNCQNVGANKSFTDALMASSQADFVIDPEAQGLYRLRLNCVSSRAKETN